GELRRGVAEPLLDHLAVENDRDAQQGRDPEALAKYLGVSRVAAVSGMATMGAVSGMGVMPGVLAVVVMVVLPDAGSARPVRAAMPCALSGELVDGGVHLAGAGLTVVIVVPWGRDRCAPLREPPVNTAEDTPRGYMCQVWQAWQSL